MKISSRRVVESSWCAAGILVAVWLLAGGVVAARQGLPLVPGMVIDRSVTVRPGIYRLSAAADLETPAITIRGENITVDFTGVTLDGSPDSADPDQFAGVGILVDGGSKVTIRGATIRGYKVGILARNSQDLHLTTNDLSHNWKQRLYSGIEKESLLDWMSYHQNEKDEWLRFGAGIYLANCDRAEIDHNIIVQGQNGLMVTASKGLKIWNNRFQFLSSIGVGLYRVSDSTIMHNRIDWCVRGYSHGFYNRGQDSAGLLMYEQSSSNKVAYNSITHGGDGLFLWAGQSTMDTGNGGSNDNLFANNDFSHAPTDGIEATFSRNRFIHNRVEDNWHGVWGGYSYGSEWVGNTFARNAEAIAIEHRQNNVIAGNTFDSDDVALWQNPTQDPNWAYPKSRDTRSRGYLIRENAFRGNKLAFDIRSTSDVRLWRNTDQAVSEWVKRSGETPGFNDDAKGVPGESRSYDPPSRLSHGIDPMIKEGERRGRRTIIVDEWGPYDWKSPKLWPVLGSDGKLPFQRRAKSAGLFDRTVKLNVLGPAGSWKLSSSRGADVSPQQGTVGDVITVTPRAAGRAGSVGLVDYQLTMTYVGGSVVSPRGVVTPAGRPYTFRYSRFFAPVDWTLSFFEVPESADPVKAPAAFSEALRGTALKTIKADRIDYLSGGALEEGVPRDRFAIVTEGSVVLPSGDYTLQVISDDGARVWVDGRLVLDAWVPHESRVDRVPITGGRHTLKLEYYEVDGWAEISLDIQPRRMRY
ncbi:MAG: right-handed parallel beta-helix repeat-containing protein [Acidobacteriota bacterium]|nr:right-handed parallel beta-helix repeat-containing protein [Acidobacteriota bacterium]